MHFHNTFSSISSQYDIFIVDLWGVIHDGQALYPHVKQTLTTLKEEGKQVIFLSNAPRRAFRAIEALEQLGLPHALYADVITSGEACYRAFAQPELGSFIANLPHNYIYIGPERDRDLLTGLPYSETTIDKAAFVIATGFDHDHSTLAEKMPQMQAALQANLPMICVNPDRIVVRQTGERSLCAGILGETYEEMGGTVYYYGKPYLTVYEACFALLKGADKKRILAVGDSLETDIRGAMQAGIDSALVTGGILGEELGLKQREAANPEKLYALCEAHNVTPTYVIPAFY